MAKLKVNRGIEKGEDDDRIRHEAGALVERDKLEKQFTKKVVAHWLKTGVLEVTRARKGGADGR